MVYEINIFLCTKNKRSLKNIGVISACVVLCMVFCMRYTLILHCIFLCILMNPVCRGERERSSVDFHLMLIHQNQVSCKRWRRCVCTRTSAPSRELASCPATFPQEDGCPATRAALSWAAVHAQNRIRCARRGWARAQLPRECRPSQWLALVPGMEKMHFMLSSLKLLIRLTASCWFGSRCCELVHSDGIALPLHRRLKAILPAESVLPFQKGPYL